MNVTGSNIGVLRNVQTGFWTLSFLCLTVPGPLSPKYS